MSTALLYLYSMYVERTTCMAVRSDDLRGGSLVAPAPGEGSLVAPVPRSSCRIPTRRIVCIDVPLVEKRGG